MRPLSLPFLLLLLLAAAARADDGSCALSAAHGSVQLGAAQAAEPIAAVHPADAVSYAGAQRTARVRGSARRGAGDGPVAASLRTPRGPAAHDVDERARFAPTPIALRSGLTASPTIRPPPTPQP